MDHTLLLDEKYADALYQELAELDIQLDSDPLLYGPKRLNAKVAESRKMLSRCERVFLDVSQRYARFNRARRLAVAELEISKKILFATDPEVRAGRNVADRDAIASVKLRAEVDEAARLDLLALDLEAVLIVIRAKRADLRDIQGRLRDQVRLCQEELTLGGRWGSRVPKSLEMEPGQGLATGKDVEDLEETIAAVVTAMDAERHLPSAPDPLQDGSASHAALLKNADAPSAVPSEEVDGDEEELGTADSPTKVLVSSSSTSDVDAFLNGLDVRQPEKRKSRRQIEDETSLDLDRLLENFGS